MIFTLPNISSRVKKVSLIVVLIASYLFFVPSVDAAVIKVSPNTGVYTVGSPFTVSVLLDTSGKSVNAADGQLTFNPKELQVVTVSRTSSIFNLWTEEPTFSNAAGTVNFGGGSPTGYKGSTGTIFKITFRALGAGTPKVNMKSGSVLAADGLGTNILTSMAGGTYTISAVTVESPPEYIAPANTPKAPFISSETHPDSSGWSKETTAKLTWSIPSGITSIRTLLDDSPSTIPTIVYDDLITEKTIEDLDEGESYFHIQFKNSEGWGKVAHYRLGVDFTAPKDFGVTVEENADVKNPGTILKFTYEDISPVTRYDVQLDGGEPVTYTDEEASKQILIDTLTPGHHTVVVQAYDSAGNSAIASHAFEISAFEKPVFTEYPSRINTEVIPAIIGKTKPDADVAISVTRESNSTPVFVMGDGETQAFSIKADASGVFTYIPPETFEPGVYSVTAIARDASGKLSEEADEIKIIVEVPGHIVFGSMVINILSIVVPLVALLLLLIFGVWYMWHKLVVWKRRITKETKEAEESLAVEFKTIITNLNKKIALLMTSRKGKLTKAETELITQIQNDLKQAQLKISKEVEDIDDVINH